MQRRRIIHLTDFGTPNGLICGGKPKNKVEDEEAI
jgi:hypothetical protein